MSPPKRPSQVPKQRLPEQVELADEAAQRLNIRPFPKKYESLMYEVAAEEGGRELADDVARINTSIELTVSKLMIDGGRGSVSKDDIEKLRRDLRAIAPYRIRAITRYHENGDKLREQAPDVFSDIEQDVFSGRDGIDALVDGIDEDQLLHNDSSVNVRYIQGQINAIDGHKGDKRFTAAHQAYLDDLKAVYSDTLTADQLQNLDYQMKNAVEFKSDRFLKKYGKFAVGSILAGLAVLYAGLDLKNSITRKSPQISLVTVGTALGAGFMLSPKSRTTIEKERSASNESISTVENIALHGTGSGVILEGFMNGGFKTEFKDVRRGTSTLAEFKDVVLQQFDDFAPGQKPSKLEQSAYDAFMALSFDDMEDLMQTLDKIKDDGAQADVINRAESL